MGNFNENIENEEKENGKFKRKYNEKKKLG